MTDPIAKTATGYRVGKVETIVSRREYQAANEETLTGEAIQTSRNIFAIVNRIAGKASK